TGGAPASDGALVLAAGGWAARGVAVGLGMESPRKKRRPRPKPRTSRTMTAPAAASPGGRTGWGRVLSTRGEPIGGGMMRVDEFASSRGAGRSEAGGDHWRAESSDSPNSAIREKR